MPTPFDRFAKETWTEVLKRAGTVNTQTEVSAETRWIDLTFEPDPALLPALHPFGLVARMVEEAPSLVEFFHAAPVLMDVLGCMRKQLEHLHSRRTAPNLWIIAAGRPTTALTELGFAPDPSWPAGIYRCPPGFRTRVVVVSELPVVRETLLLRVLGARQTFTNAVAELRGLSDAEPEAAIALPILLNLLREITTRTNPPDPEEEEFVMSAQSEYQAWKRELLEKGLQSGAEKALRSTLSRQLSARFGVLTPTVSKRIDGAPTADLERWLDRILTATSIDDVLAG